MTKILYILKWYVHCFELLTVSSSILICLECSMARLVGGGLCNLFLVPVNPHLHTSLTPRVGLWKKVQVHTASCFSWADQFPGLGTLVLGRQFAPFNGINDCRCVAITDSCPHLATMIGACNFLFVHCP